MTQLFLLRHAKSSWDDSELVDHDRPLAPRGRRAAKLVAEHLGREGIIPALVLCSSARRTRETLERIAQTGLFEAIEQATFGDVSRGVGEGRGIEGIVATADAYFNPVVDVMREASYA